MSRVHDRLDRYRAACKRRDAWFPLWQELSDILLPTRGNFTSQQIPGQESQKNLYDSTPMQARRGLATAIDGLLKPSTTRWFWMKSKDEALNEDDEVKRWFEDVGDRMWQAIYAPRARFTASSGAVDNDLATFGIGYLWCEENADRNGLTFQCLHIKDVAIEEDAEGVINTYYVTRKYNARQALQKFPDADMRQVREAAEDPNAAGKTFEFVQCIYPRKERDRYSRDNRDMPFASEIIFVDDEELVEETGYAELPISAPRWEVSPGEIYPRSPGMMALPDARTLQAMGKTLLIAGQRAVDPPVWITDDGALSPVRTYPGALTVVSTQAAQDTNGRPIGVLDTSGNLPYGLDMQQRVQEQVEAAFFKNVFQLPIEVAGKMTATEVMERKEEFLRTIGPVMGQLETDYIGSVVERVFNIMARASTDADGNWIEGGPLPPPPDELRGASIDFEFMSPIQQARRQIEAAGMMRAWEFIAPLIQTQPELAQRFNGEEIIKDVPDIFQLPQTWIRTDDEYAQIVQQQRQAQEMMMALQGGQQAADIGQKVAGAEAQLAKAQGNG